MEKTIFLLDTNVLLNDPGSLFSFPQGIVGLHFSVLEELDSFKKESCLERGYNARESIRILSDLANRTSLLKGVTLGNGGILKIFMPVEKKISGLSLEKNDDKIIVLAKYLKENGNKVILVSKDLNMRIRASCLDIEAIDFNPSEEITRETFYQGWKEFTFPSGDIKNNSKKILNDLLKENDFSINEFILLKSSHKNNYYRIFRYKGDNDFKEVKIDKEKIWGLEPKNYHQEMVIDLLMDDSIKLVILFGPSGTGKTFLVLATMLYKILCEQAYQKLLVSRPLVPLGSDIGFLPGDLYEKLQTWMQPVRDNLDYLVYHINRNSSQTICESEESFSKKKRKKRWGESESRRYLHTEDLIGINGKISLEAITYMRGRSIPQQVIFIDEVQNLTAHEVKTLISRAGEGTKIILAGDPYQIDSPYLDFVTNGLVVASEKFKGQSVFGTVYLQFSERSILSCLANELM